MPLRHYWHQYWCFHYYHWLQNTLLSPYCYYAIIYYWCHLVIFTPYVTITVSSFSFITIISLLITNTSVIVIILVITRHANTPFHWSAFRLRHFSQSSLILVTSWYCQPLMLSYVITYYAITPPFALRCHIIIAAAYYFIFFLFAISLLSFFISLDYFLRTFDTFHYHFAIVSFHFRHYASISPRHWRRAIADIYHIFTYAISRWSMLTIRWCQPLFISRFPPLLPPLIIAADILFTSFHTPFSLRYYHFITPSSFILLHYFADIFHYIDAIIAAFAFMLLLRRFIIFRLLACGHFRWHMPPSTPFPSDTLSLMPIYWCHFFHRLPLLRFSFISFCVFWLFFRALFLFFRHAD